MAGFCNEKCLRSYLTEIILGELDGYNENELEGKSVSELIEIYEDELGTLGERL